MLFTAEQKERFGADAGAFSEVTDTEAKQHQLTLDAHEKEILFSVIRPSDIHRGAIGALPREGLHRFRSHANGQPVDLNVNYPKTSGDEIRLYTSSEAGFAPESGDTWFLYRRGKELSIGSMNARAWETVVAKAPASGGAGSSTRDLFTTWLQNEKSLSDKSVQSYVTAVAGLLSDLAEKALFHVEEVGDLIDLAAKVRDNGEYDTRNTTGNNMYSAALMHFEEFSVSRNVETAFGAICALCRIHETSSESWLRSDPRAKLIQKALSSLQAWFNERLGEHDGVNMSVQVSTGAGRFPRVPWVCLVPPEQQVKDGVFVAVCFGKEGHGAVAGFAESTQNRKGLDVAKRSHEKPLWIDVDGGSSTTRYNDTFENPVEFEPASLDTHALMQHVQASLDRCIEFLKLGGVRAIVEPHQILQSFNEASRLTGFRSPPTFAGRLLAAMSTKPFTILTGLSGSGKTLSALLFAKWITADAGQMAVISVGADWTSNENLLGYPDALKEKSYRKPDNGALELVLKAKADSSNPYFLILDEMNLSHVERYFSDFLSAMESREAINLHDDTGTEWDGIPAKLKIPKNLFVIGTVNVDETTYMFSPKVLDRANVIEFRIAAAEMTAFLENPAKPNLDTLAGKGAKYAKAFAALAKRENAELGSEIREEVSEVLMEFFPDLKEAGAEFGYRTAHEICRFVHFHNKLTGEDWQFAPAMDAAIMQKLLPKLHGARRKLEPVLEKLEKLCKSGGNETNEIRYPSSLEKIQRMLKRLREHGFTSFAEA